MAPPAPTNTQRALYSEITRKTFADTQFVDGDGVPVAYPLGSAEGQGGVYACCGWSDGGKPVAVYDERLPKSWLPTIYRHETNHILVTCSTGRSDPKHADETWDSADLWLFGLVRGGT